MTTISKTVGATLAIVGLWMVGASVITSRQDDKTAMRQELLALKNQGTLQKVASMPVWKGMELEGKELGPSIGERSPVEVFKSPHGLVVEMFSKSGYTLKIVEQTVDVNGNPQSPISYPLEEKPLRVPHRRPGPSVPGWSCGGSPG